MNQSPNNKSRGKIRRGRKLRQQRERIDARGEGKYVPDELTFGAFLKRQKGLIIFAVILAGAIWGVTKLAPDQKADPVLSNSVDSMISDRTPEWDKAYPYGYKIIVLTDQEIMYTGYDTFSPDFKINWKDLSVTRIQANQLERTEEKIKITSPKIRYMPQGISSLSNITTILSGKKGMKSGLGKFGKFEFIFEIVEDKEGRLFCLFGIKDI